LLRAYLHRNADTAFGREYGFTNISDISTYQQRVPVVSYEGIAPWVERIAKGEPRVLTTEPVKVLERTSGGYGRDKLIPYTESLLTEFSAATNPWIFDLYRQRPRLMGTSSYWSVSPATRKKEYSEGGLAIGFDDDTEYFSGLQRSILNRLMAVPGDVARISDFETWRRVTLTHLLSDSDLGLISVWNPSFLTLLMEALAEDLNGYLDVLPAPRRKGLQRRLERAGTLTGEVLWPKLGLISCWTDGVAGQFLGDLRRWFPKTEIQGKGLLATEGVISFPLTGQSGAVAAVNSHFMEFKDLQNPNATPLLVNQLREGGHYSPIISTGAGFYRYALGDALRCVGHYRHVPLFKFEGRVDKTSDICGEKLSIRMVDLAMEKARQASGLSSRFAMLAPRLTRPPQYVLYLETNDQQSVVENFLAIIEAELSQSQHYNYCRTLGQLGPVTLKRVVHGQQTYLDTLVGLGVRRGDIKPTHLDGRSIWDEHF
jgi:hypothetical protein